MPGEDPLIEAPTRTNIPEILPTIQKKLNRKHHSFDYANVGVPKHEMTSMSKEGSSERGDDNLGDNVIGGRSFSWKIISYTQCSRSCGGGFQVILIFYVNLSHNYAFYKYLRISLTFDQVGKYRCVESDAKSSNREISPVHCNGSPPAARRQRCGNVPCAPRWRAAAWSSCPQCGPALRTRIVGCVQDHSRGISKVR